MAGQEISRLRRILKSKFDYDSLERLCFNHFYKIHEEIIGSNPDDIIELLIQYVEQNQHEKRKLIHILRQEHPKLIKQLDGMNTIGKPNNQSDGWRNWGDHPAVVAVSIVSAIIAIIIFVTGRPSLPEWINWNRPSEEIRPSFIPGSNIVVMEDSGAFKTYGQTISI